MNKLCFVLVFYSFVFCQCAEVSILQSEYGDRLTLTDSRTVTIRTEKDEYGDWVTTISSYQTLDKDSQVYALEVNRNILEVDGKEVAHVQAVVKGPRGKKTAIPEECLLFQESGAKNAVISNNRTTVQRINEIDSIGFGGIVTNRALREDELFEVKVERLITNYEDSLGIGVTYHTPDQIDYLNWLMCGTIILYDVRLYENGVVTNEKYGPDLRKLKVGDRLGVMKKSNGNVHFFVNGYDQGVAKSGVTYPVYGVLDLYGNGVQASVV